MRGVTVKTLVIHGALFIVTGALGLLAGCVAGFLLVVWSVG